MLLKKLLFSVMANRDALITGGISWAVYLVFTRKHSLLCQYSQAGNTVELQYNGHSAHILVCVCVVGYLNQQSASTATNALTELEHHWMTWIIIHVLVCYGLPERRERETLSERLKLSIANETNNGVKELLKIILIILFL